MQLNQTSTEISGQKLWCGSLVLCEYILDHAADVVKDKIVIELGAGTGVAGMICYQQGASKVYLSDYDAKSLEHMRVDCEDNGIAADIVSFDYYNPIYETFEGWSESTQGARSWAQLPATAIKYIRRVEELIEAPVSLLSTSPEREDTILVRDPFAD